MSDRHVSGALPAYANGTLPPEESRRVREHLRGCPDCAAELAEWELLSAAARAVVAAAAPPRVPAGVWAEVGPEPHRAPRGSRRPVAAISLLWQLLVGQVPLVRRAIWAASAVTMAVGLLAALFATTPTAGGLVLGLLAPLVAAMGVALVYGPENDPGLEVALATPTAPRLVLLARLTLVYGYDLGLALLATLVLAARGGADPLPLISLWIGPMLFLSALALLLSLLLDATAALLVSMGLWSVRLIAAADLGGGRPSAVADPLDGLWHNTPLLLPLAALLLLAALWYGPGRERLA